MKIIVLPQAADELDAGQGQRLETIMIGAVFPAEGDGGLIEGPALGIEPRSGNQAMEVGMELQALVPGVEREMGRSATGTGEGAGAQRRGATMGNGIQGAALRRRQGAVVRMPGGVGAAGTGEGAEGRGRGVDSLSSRRRPVGLRWRRGLDERMELFIRPDPSIFSSMLLPKTPADRPAHKLPRRAAPLFNQALEPTETRGAVLDMAALVSLVSSGLRGSVLREVDK